MILERYGRKPGSPPFIRYHSARSFLPKLGPLTLRKTQMQFMTIVWLPLMG